MKRGFKMNKSVVFDVDGTLIDGTEGVLQSVTSTIEYYNLHNLSKNELLSFIGPPIQDSVKRIYNLDDEKAQLFANHFRKIYSEGDVYKAFVYDGIYELLDSLKKEGCKLGVATYKREDYAISLMEHFKLDKYFNSICGADNENKLTKTDVLQNCVNSISAACSETIMIGDSFHDALASQKLGIKFIAVTYGFGFKSVSDAQKYDSIFIANTPNEIQNFLINECNEVK